MSTKIEGLDYAAVLSLVRVMQKATTQLLGIMEDFRYLIVCLKNEEEERIKKGQ